MLGNQKQPPSRNRSQDDMKRKRSAKRERRRPIWRILGITGLTVGGIVIVGLGTAAGYASAMLKGLPPVSADQLTNLSQPTVVYDRNGQLIGKFAAEGDRQPIASTKDVSQNLVQAFIAAEDKTFYSNIGINPLAMGRAAVQDVFHHRLLSGASTITQQTVKLAMFPEQQRTKKRKIQEIALALEVNHMLTKDEIMTDYMNWVYMGKMGTQNVYGVKPAAQIMFQKDVKNLTLPEAAFLAAIPNNAVIFSPYDHNGQNTVKREQYILQQMLADGMITQQRYDDAVKVDVTKELKKAVPTSMKYPYLMRLNIEPLVAKALVDASKYDTVSDAEKALPTAGYKIYTTIDLTKQDDIDNVLKNDALFAGTTKPAIGLNGRPIKGSDGKQLQDLYEAGVTLIDNQTGGILAIGGGRQFNNAYTDHSDIPRQPGSSIKPLLDYGPAIDMHQISAASSLFDAPVTYPGVGGQPWSPHDDETNWAGIMTAREALVQSRNVPAIRLLDKISPQAAGPYLEKMGITPGARTLSGAPTLVSSDLTHLSSAIGGLSNGLTVQQLTSAYTVFPNQGTWRPSFIISKVTDRNGYLVYQEQSQTHQVFSPQTAYIMTSMMHDVVYKGDGTAIAIGSHFPGQYISGKTGTTDSQRDGWFIGYTQKYTMGIWMGYDYHEQINLGPDYNLKFKLWNLMMDPLLKNSPATTPFPQPQGIDTVAVCSKSGQLPTNLCKSDNDVYNELFITGTEPTGSCQTHVAAQYTVVNGKRYLATTNTPPGEVMTGVFLVPPAPLQPGVTTADSFEYIPTAPDPRGGTVLQGAGSSNPVPPPGTPSGSGVSAPAHIQAGLTPSGAVQLVWTPVNGATGYTVWRSKSATGPFTNIAGPMTANSFVDSVLPAKASTVYYQVYAVGTTGTSGPSSVVSVSLHGGGTGNTTGHGNGTGLPDMLWPNSDHFRSRS